MLIVVSLVLATGPVIIAGSGSTSGTGEKPAMIGFGNNQMENIDSSILAVNVDNLEPKVAKKYIKTQISKLRPVIVVGTPQRVLHEILNGTNVVAVPVAMIINGKEIPIKKVVIGYIPRKVGSKIGGKILCQGYTGTESVASIYQKIKKIESEEQPVALS